MFVVSVFGALALQCVAYMSDGVVIVHVVERFWVNECMSVKGMLVKKSSVCCGGWCWEDEV